MLAAMVILLLVFGSAVAMGLPIVTAVLGLLCGLSVVTLLSHIADVPTTAPTLATMIGLAVGIDDSLFIVTKHRTQVAEGMEVRESIARASATGGRRGPVRGRHRRHLPSGARGRRHPVGHDAGLHVGDRCRLRDSCRADPAAGPVRAARMHVSALKLPFGHGRAAQTQSRFWTRFGTWITNHPWPVMIAVLAALLALAIPTLSMRLGQEDVGAEPTDTTARQAYDLITKGFGAGTNGPFLISVNLSKAAKPDQKNLNTISQNEKQLQQQQQQIEQQAELEGATQQQAEDEAKQQTQKQSNDLANKKKKAEQPATDPRLQTLRNRPPEDQGRQVGDAAVGQQERVRGGLHADSHDLALRPRHRGPGLAPEGLDDPEGDQGPGHDGVRRRHDSGVCRPRRQDHQEAPSGHPGRGGAQLPGAAGRVPLAPACRPRPL